MENKELMECSKFDNSASSIVVFHIYVMICKNMIVNVNDFFYFYNDKLNTFITIVMLLLYLKLVVFSNLLSHLKGKTIACILLGFLFVLITFLIDPTRFVSNYFPYTYVKRQLRTFVAYCFPLFVVMSSLSTYNCLLKKLYDWVYIPFLFSSFAFLLSLQPHENGIYMAYGNAVLTISLILLFRWYHTRSFFDISAFLLTAIYILISGSRGPLISLVVAVFFVLFLLQKKNIFCMLFFSIVVLLVLFFHNEILMYIISLCNRFHINSRTLYMFLSDKISDDSGRSEIHENLLAQLKQSPLLGLGAFGGEATVGLSHSLYLDILANFGLVFGGFFIGYIVLKDVYLIIKNKYSSVSELLLIFSLFLFPRGFFDENFWGSKELWIIMAIFIHVHNNKKYPVFTYTLRKQKGKRQL